MITPLTCSLAGRQEIVHVHSGTEQGGLRVSGTDANGEIRIVELAGHLFFLATLFLPRTRSTPAAPHPLIAGYAAAIRARSASS